MGNDGEVAYNRFVLRGTKGSATYLAGEASESAFTGDKGDSALSSLTLEEQGLMGTPGTLSVFRPATDNENCDRNGAYLWRKAGLNQLTQKVVSLKDGKKAATAKVEILNAKGMKVGDADFAYSLNSAGALKVKVTFRPDTAVVKSMARLGLTFEMNDTYGNVAYLGRGDNETYSDRMQSGKIALYQTTAERMFHYYVTPQSTGNRTDVRWMKLTDEAGQGIFVDSNRPFQFSVIPFADDVLEKARHINDLERNGHVTVHLDAEQAGVGTATCGPGVQPEYRLPVTNQSFEYTLRTVK